MVFTGAVLIVGLTPALQRKLFQRGIIPDQYNYGDLYNKTNLVQFKDENYHAVDSLDTTDIPATKIKGVHLFTLGDSFTDIDTVFYGGEKNTHIWVPNRLTPARLDKRDKNIVVIEVIERVLQERMQGKFWRMYIDNVLPDLSLPDAVSNTTEEHGINFLRGRFGSGVNNRLEFTVFNNSLALRLKELKAKILLDYFGRTQGGRLSLDKQHVLYDLEVDTTSQLSSFRYLSDAVIDSTVNKLNLIHDYYRSKGFDKVYISLIPNKSTIVAPELGRYNHQIERIEKHPNLKPAVISLIDTLRYHPEWYHLGDGHWNKYGKRYWLQRINETVGSPVNL